MHPYVAYPLKQFGRRRLVWDWRLEGQFFDNESIEKKVRMQEYDFQRNDEEQK
jgi:hypothetical protein